MLCSEMDVSVTRYRKYNIRLGRTTALCIIMAVPCMVMLSSCSIKELSTEKLRDVEFTVVDTDDIPEELMTEIEASKEKEMKISYGDEGYLYIVRGYGEQDTTGYSVSVDACYETENAISLDTSLLGPEKGEEILEKQTYPYVVIKIEYTEKQVITDGGN